MHFLGLEMISWLVNGRPMCLLGLDGEPFPVSLSIWGERFIPPFIVFLLVPFVPLMVLLLFILG